MAKKKFDYFNYFKDVSSIICEAAQHLHSTLHNYNPESLIPELKAMHDIEHKADCAKHEMTKLLAHEFITPIEREDIVSLAQMLDTIVDNIEDVLLRTYMFNVKSITKEAIEFSDVLIRCTEKLDYVQKKKKNFKNPTKLREYIVEVNNCESEGDKLLVDGVRSIAVSNCSDRDLFIWTELYEHLEDCLDSCEDVTDIIEEVILKNT